jgi:conjugal transfer pilus assembly protein TraB
MPGTGVPIKPLSGSGAIRIIEDELKGKTKEAEHDQSASKKGKNDEWIPSGSFMKVVLLNGIDAPTSGGSQAEPYPVLMSILDLTTLPNRFRLDMRECFVIGAGYGNLSDERAYIRTERLSCVRKDGQAVDFDLKGHIIGEDGKLGLRGRVVSKQGQQIGMALFAGTLAGLGTALKPTGNVTLNLGDNSTTSVTRPNVGDVATSAGLGGVGNALDRVAQYYLKWAEKLFPVIEIDAGRSVEVVILQGRSLKQTGTGDNMVNMKSTK